MNTHWRINTLSNGIKRYRLVVMVPCGEWEVYTETPYFIDREKYYSYLPGKYQLLGSGMHPSGCAQGLGFYERLSQAKAEAMRMMLADFAKCKQEV